MSSEIWYNTLTLKKDNVASYKLRVDDNVVSAPYSDFAVHIDSSNYHYMVLNDSAKNHLFPNGTANPNKVNFNCRFKRSGFALIISRKAYVYLDVNGTRLFGFSTNNSSDTGVTQSGTSSDTAITGSNRATMLSIGGYSESAACGIFEVSIQYCFTRYDFSAVAGIGIASASVSSSTGYDGDTVTFSCVIPTGYAFDGWYSGSTLVSSSQSYTHTVNGADLSLTARTTATTCTLSVTYGGTSIINTQVTPPVAVSYGGTQIASVASGETKTLKTFKAGKPSLLVAPITIGNKVISDVNSSGKKWKFEHDIIVSVKAQPENPYTFLSHISTTNGAAYINTGVNPDNPVIEFQFSDFQRADNTAWLIGSYELDHYFAIGHSDHYATAYMSANDTSGISIVAQNYDVVRIDTTHVTVNGATIKTTSGDYAKSGNNFLLFGASRDGTPYNPTRMARLSMQYCKIWDGVTLVRDFVPAMRNSDGAVGMLDRVNDVFYTSGTSTPFIAGDPLNS